MRRGLARTSLAEDEEYWAALSRGDRRAAVARMTELLDAGRPVLELLQDVCLVQERIGALWQRAEWSVAQEHAATAISDDVVTTLGVRNDVEPARGLAVVACPSGEWHYLAAKVVCEVLRLAGWRCHYLGASLPPDQMALLVEDLGPDVVALSCSVPSTLPGLRSMVEAVRESGTPVLVGGRGAGPQGRWALRVGATAWAGSPAHAVERLERPDWPRFVAPVPQLRHPDTEWEELLASTDALAAKAMFRLRERWSGLDGYSPRQLRTTEEDLRHIVRFLAASLLVDDDSLFTEFLQWLADVLQARSVPLEGLRVGLECLDPPGPRANQLLRSARSLLETA